MIMSGLYEEICQEWEGRMRARDGGNGGGEMGSMMEGKKFSTSIDASLTLDRNKEESNSN